ncbi:MAG TPA: sigma 54-interacting transcriptional regulator, partial [Burkholderiales bacterium]|nr:sigma 54-interacting transcriptional regulator [Burkholderiales bacterium]
ADEGTLLLDEIGDMSLTTQSKILRVLQEQEFERVGGTRTLRTDVRVIAATNHDPRDLVARGAFRADLYYRLNVFPLGLPPLRERRDDIPRLIRHFMARAAHKLGKRFEHLASGFVEQAMAYDWPGNVRELENFVERAAILSSGSTLDAPDMFASQVVPVSAPDSAAPSHAETSLEDVERAHIVRVLEKTKWVIQGEHGAARVLGLKPSTLRGRMRKLGIRVVTRRHI